MFVTHLIVPESLKFYPGVGFLISERFEKYCCYILLSTLRENNFFFFHYVTAVENYNSENLNISRKIKAG